MAALLLASCGGQSAPELDVSDAWARSTLAGKNSTAAYLTITNRGGADDALVAVRSGAGSASLHSTSTADGIMRMRELDRLPIPAGETVKLEPGGTHVMIAGLEAPVRAGDTVDLSLQFEKSGEREVRAQVRSPSGAAM